MCECVIVRYYRNDEDYRLSICGKDCWYLRDFLLTLTTYVPNSPEQMSHDTWCWTLFHAEESVLQAHALALDQYCQTDGYMRAELVPVDQV